MNLQKGYSQPCRERSNASEPGRLPSFAQPPTGRKKLTRSLRSSWRILWLALPFIWLPSLPAISQTGIKDEIRIELGSAKGVPGSKARIPLTLFLPDKVPPIRKIVEKVCFSEQFVRFVELEPGAAARSAGAHIDSKLEQRGECKLLILEATFEKPPASGTIANLVFDIDGTAPLDHNIELKSECRVLGPDGDMAAAAGNGKIQIVEVDPIFGCFFYMH